MQLNIAMVVLFCFIPIHLRFYLRCLKTSTSILKNILVNLQLHFTKEKMLNIIIK